MGKLHIICQSHMFHAWHLPTMAESVVKCWLKLLAKWSTLENVKSKKLHKKWSYGSTWSPIYIRHYVQLHRLWYVSPAIRVALSAGLNTQCHIVTAKLSNIKSTLWRCWLPLFFHQTFLYDETVLHQKTYRSLFLKRPGVSFWKKVWKKGLHFTTSNCKVGPYKL